MIVVDASVVATAVSVRGEDGDRVRDRLIAENDLHAPHLVDLEVASVLRRRARQGDIGGSEADQALQELSRLPLTRYPHFPLLPRIWELRSNLSSYDAAYVALAEALGCTFVTGDRRIAQAPGLRCHLETM
ncbi:MAG: PIN domain-containing protein [Actinobacteria bacterium]|nr:PIN domain-containing protein [Actinomycetota bacterium]